MAQSIRKEVSRNAHADEDVPAQLRPEAERPRRDDEGDDGAVRDVQPEQDVEHGLTD